ncbi:unnamed protein product [Closterium sp. NIES-54]
MHSTGRILTGDPPSCSASVAPLIASPSLPQQLPSPPTHALDDLVLPALTGESPVHDPLPPMHPSLDSCLALLSAILAATSLS